MGHWGLAGSVGTQEPPDIEVMWRHWGLLGGVGGVGSALEVAGGLGDQPH